MIKLVSEFQPLLDDELYAEGLLASDAPSLWRRLSRNERVQTVAGDLVSDPHRIRSLVRFVKDILGEGHNTGYRHPNDIAICAGLVVLRDSPLPEVRNLFYTLRRESKPSLAWVRRLADYCDDRIAQTSIAHQLFRPIDSHVSTWTPLSDSNCSIQGTSRTTAMNELVLA